MNELIKIQQSSIGNEVKQTVNARDLHEFLGNKDRFATWIKDRIEQFDFQENEDFVTFSENSEKGRPRTEYALTLDMAKELSMVERNDKGKEARKYFLECERIAKTQPMLPQTYKQALLALVEAEEIKEQLLLENQEKTLQITEQQVVIEEAKPKVQVYDELIQDDTLIKIDTAAKMCGVKPTEFRMWFRSYVSGFCRQDRGSEGVPNQESIDRGYLVAKWRQFEEHVSCTAYFLNKGVEIAKKRIRRLSEINPYGYNNMFTKTLKGDTK